MRYRKLAALLCLGMCLACTPVCAADTQEGAEEEEWSFDLDALAEKKESDEELEELILKEQTMGKDIWELGSTDQVIIADNVYTVISEFGTTSLTLGFGWYCLTQDIALQQLEYQQILQDPVTFLQETMIPKGYHYAIFDSDFTVRIFQRQYSDEPSQAIGDANSLTAKQDAKYLESLTNSSFEGYFSATLDAGGNHYFCFLSPDNRKAFYETIVNGVNYDFWVYSSEEEGGLSREVVAGFEELLDSFAIA